MSYLEKLFRTVKYTQWTKMRCAIIQMYKICSEMDNISPQERSVYINRQHSCILSALSKCLQYAWKVHKHTFYNTNVYINVQVELFETYKYNFLMKVCVKWKQSPTPCSSYQYLPSYRICLDPGIWSFGISYMNFKLFCKLITSYDMQG